MTIAVVTYRVSYSSLCVPPSLPFHTSSSLPFFVSFYPRLAAPSTPDRFTCTSKRLIYVSDTVASTNRSGDKDLLILSLKLVYRQSIETFFFSSLSKCNVRVLHTHTHTRSRCGTRARRQLTSPFSNLIIGSLRFRISLILSFFSFFPFFIIAMEIE